MKMQFCCPECKSSDIRRKYFVPISKEGYLPKPPIDLCNNCGYSSEESFIIINTRNVRESKLEQLLYGA